MMCDASENSDNRVTTMIDDDKGHTDDDNNDQDDDNEIGDHDEA